MRGLIAYLLSILVLLNFGGYHALFLGLQHRTSENLLNKLDANTFDHEEAFLVKVPLTVPYASDSKDFERVNGEFIHEGQVYRLVKQKLSKDTLHVVVLEDKLGTYINKVKTDLVKSLSDLPKKDNSPSSKIFKLIIKDYINTIVVIEVASIGWSDSNPLKSYINFYSFKNLSKYFIPPPVTLIS
ncbi:MAG: hypothetical protein M3512_10870 [Bacteroidota bacterium]|nr:hypothetical protein [Bacteroidota bacterium]